MKNLWHHHGGLWEKLACTSKDVCKINIPDHACAMQDIGSEKFYRQTSAKQIAPDSSETLFDERL